MKSLSLLAVISLALSVSAANQGFQQNGRNNNVFGGNRGGFGNNNGFFGGQQGGQFGGNNGRNGQNNQNNNGKGANNAGNANNGKNGNNGQNNNNGNKNVNNGKGAGSSVAATTAAAANTAAANTAAAAATTAAAAANTAAAANSGDAQSSTTLDPKVIATGFENDGQDVPTAGQVSSLTSSNNFINFCLTVPNLPITNGKQITTGSCNPAPMGSIPSTDNMPSSKFTIPKNGDSIPENTAFTITMAVANFQTGAFVNAQENYFAAPQQLNGQGQIIGHSHVVVEQLTSLDQTTPTDPKKFAFFKGLNAAAVNGLLTADVTAGLPAGFYKVSSINTAANHQPVLVPIAQHGSLDDVSYFTVTASGAAAASSVASSAAAAATTAAAASGGKLSAVAAPGPKAVAPAKVPFPKNQQGKQGKRAHARSFF